MSTSLIGKVFQGSKTEIGRTSEAENITALIKVKIINDSLYACLYQEWKGAAGEPYLEKNFIGAYLMKNGIKLIGLGDLRNPQTASIAILDVDFRHPFVEISFPYLLIESLEESPTKNTWDQFLIN